MRQNLTLLRHSFECADAFYDCNTLSLHVGYFAATIDDPVEPPRPDEQHVLTHEIMAHETIHTLVD